MCTVLKKLQTTPSSSEGIMVSTYAKGMSPSWSRRTEKESTNVVAGPPLMTWHTMSITRDIAIHHQRKVVTKLLTGRWISEEDCIST